MERPHIRDTYVPPNRRVAAPAGRVSLGPSCGGGVAGALFGELATFADFCRRVAAADRAIAAVPFVPGMLPDGAF
jgi:hypothetical protein